MFFDTLRSDIRHTLRLAVKQPLFTTLTVLALALGIGATSAIFAVVNGVLLRPLPYSDAGRLVNIWSDNSIGKAPTNPISPANFLDFQKMNTTFESMDAYYTFMSPMAMRTDAGTELANSVYVGPNLFSVLGRNTAALGRRSRPMTCPVWCRAERWCWQRRFGAIPPSSASLTLANFPAPVRIVGVMPPDFVFPFGNMFGPSGFTRVTIVDMWLPIAYSRPASGRLEPHADAQGQLVRNVHWFGASAASSPASRATGGS